MTLKFGSLFSGIGGFDLGFERAGMECAWQVEINKYARAVLATHWPDVKRYEDVRNVGAANLEAVDVVCGGFPCQDVSVAGQRAGLAGKRSGLWFEFRRIVAELKPKWVVIENVYGLLSSNGGRDFAVILQGLVECGYGVGWRVFDAQYAGVPQRRRRVFIVGHLGDGRAAEVLFERYSSQWDSPPRRETRQKITGTLGASAGRNRGLGLENEHEFLVLGQPAQEKTTQASDRMLAFGHYSESDSASTIKARDGRDATDLVVFDTTQITSKANASNPQAGDPCHPLASSAHPPAIVIADRVDRWVETEDRIRAVQSGKAQSTVQEHVYFKPNGITNALEANRPTKIIHKKVRRLTPVECERLQGFPNDFTAGQSDSQRYFQLGNAVCVNEAEALGSRIVAVAK